MTVINAGPNPVWRVGGRYLVECGGVGRAAMALTAFGRWRFKWFADMGIMAFHCDGVYKYSRNFTDMKLILIGAPGAGKGTIAKLLSAEDGSVQISTGDILRSAIAADSALGRKAGEHMRRGELVPDDLIMALMESRLQHADCANGFLLDGFPRTIPQAEALNKLLGKLNIVLDMVVNIEVPQAVVLDRLTTRRTCENPTCQEIYNIKSKPPLVAGICDRCGSAAVQREDETEDAISQRLQIYNEKTAPLIGFYEGHGLLVNVESTSSEAVIRVVMDELERGR